MIDLFEARAETAIATMTRYASRPNVFATFIDVVKLGINPSSVYGDTPLGIYAYPIADALAMMKTKTVSFAWARKYICIFEAHGEILNLQTYTSADYEDDIERLAMQWRYLDPKNQTFANNLLLNWDEKIGTSAASPGGAIWAMVEKFANRAGKLYGRKPMITSNTLWRALGYSGVVDNGDRIIYHTEPTQAVFFSRGDCRIIDLLINDHLSDSIPPAFPERGQKKKRGFVDRTQPDPESMAG